MNGKNNLEYSTVLDMNDAETVGSNGNVHMVVEFGRIKGNGRKGDSVAQGDWGGVRRYYVKKDRSRKKISSSIVQYRGNADMGDWHELTDFVRWAKANYPADKYFLAVWDHGFGWKTLKARNDSKMKPRNVKGVSSDDSTGNEISVQDMARALARSGGVDVLAFDTCLMQGMETVFEIKKHADYIVGSEAMEPGSVKRYGKLLSYLQANPNTDGKQAAGHWVDLYKNFFTTGTTKEKKDKTEGIVVTHSVIDAKKLDDFAGLLETWTSLALSSWDENAMALAKKRVKRFDHNEYCDLVDFVSLVGANHSDPAVTAAGDALIQFAKEDLVTSNWSRSKRSHGLYIYVPSKKYSPLFETLAFARQGSWPELAKKLALINIDKLK